MPTAALGVAAVLLLLQSLRVDFLYYCKQLKHNSEKAVEMFINKKLKVNSKLAECSNLQDQEMIRTEIEKGGGYEQVDEFVFYKRVEMVLKIAEESNDTDLKLLSGDALCLDDPFI